jgi:hypothetical protein
MDAFPLKGFVANGVTVVVPPIMLQSVVPLSVRGRAAQGRISRAAPDHAADLVGFQPVISGPG